MIGGCYVKVHQHGTGAAGGQSGSGARQRGLTTKLHLAVDALGMPVRLLATEGTVAHCTRAEALADRGI